MGSGITMKPLAQDYVRPVWHGLGICNPQTQSSSGQQAPGLRGTHGFSHDALEELFGKESFPDRQRGLHKREILIFISPFDDVDPKIRTRWFFTYAA